MDATYPRALISAGSLPFFAAPLLIAHPQRLTVGPTVRYRPPQLYTCLLRMLGRAGPYKDTTMQAGAFIADANALQAAKLRECHALRNSRRAGYLVGMNTPSKIHHATHDRRVEQIKAAYAKVQWTKGHRMTRASRAQWLGWLSAFGIGEGRAQQLMRD